jgi:hypothetical protein
MKKLLFLTAAIVASVAVFSQVRFGVKGGLNLANQKVKVSLLGESISRTGDGIVSFHVGGVAEIPITQSFAFRPELLLSGKGTNLDAEEDSTGNPVEAKFRPFYLELPLNFVYVHEFPTLRFFTGFGPSIAYGIFGKVKSGGEEDDFFQEDAFKRFDFGFNLLAGIELNSGLTFGVNLTPGLANISELDLDEVDVKWRNTVFSFSVGYMFGRKGQQ